MIIPEIKTLSSPHEEFLYMSRFIAVEGLDNVGKGAVIASLEKAMKERYGEDKVVVVPFPDKSSPLVQAAFQNAHNHAGMLLMLAANYLHFKNEVYPHLREQKYVIADRYIWSNMVYQSLGIEGPKATLPKEADDNVGIHGDEEVTTGPLTHVRHWNFSLADKFLEYTKDVFLDYHQSSILLKLVSDSGDYGIQIQEDDHFQKEVGVLGVPAILVHIKAPKERREEWMQREAELGKKPFIREDYDSLERHEQYETLMDLAMDFIEADTRYTFNNTATLERLCTSVNSSVLVRLDENEALIQEVLRETGHLDDFSSEDDR